MTTNDVAESTVHSMEEKFRRYSGSSVLHWLTIGSIAASVGLFVAGKKHLAIFVGLWPPTLQALRQGNR